MAKSPKKDMKSSSQEAAVTPAEEKPKTLICVLRASKGLWDSLKQLEQNSDGQVIVWQGQAKTYNNGGINAKLFADQDWDDHPGPAPSAEEKEAIKQALATQNHDRIIVNSFVGEHASDRCQAAEYVLAHLAQIYPNTGRTEYFLSYDGNARNDKVHSVDAVDDKGNTAKVSEDNAPGGVYAPVIYKAIGVTDITLIDPHSYYQVSNYTDVFGKDRVKILSGLEQIATSLVERHKQNILDGTFRIGAPDGWDKRNDPNGNAALDRVQEVLELVWQKMPELAQMYHDPQQFQQAVQFGIVKTRQTQKPGGPALPKTLEMHGDVTNCVCILLDDEVESGSSITGAADLLIAKNAGRVEACICHGPTYEASFNKLLDHTYDDAENVPQLAVKRLTVSNTMARVEGAHGNGFISQLTEQKQKRTTMLNCGEEYCDYLYKALGIEKKTPAAIAAAPEPRKNGGFLGFFNGK